MDNEKDVWERVSCAAESTSRGIKRGFGEYINEISLAVCLVFTVAISLVTVEIRNPFSAEFIMNTVYMLLCTYTSYLVFIPSGKRDELSRIGEGTGSRWRELCDRVRREGLLERFAVYCKEEAERECAERRHRMAENACIGRDRYLSELARLKRHELNAEVKAGKISKGQARALLRASGIRPEPINPSIILSECRESNINDAGRHRMSYEQKSQISRPIIMLVSSMCFASAILVPTGSIGVGVAVSVLARLFQVCLASFTGYNVGVKEIRWEISRIEGKILFIERFFEAESQREGKTAEDGAV